MEFWIGRRGREEPSVSIWRPFWDNTFEGREGRSSKFTDVRTWRRLSIKAGDNRIFDLLEPEIEEITKNFLQTLHLQKCIHFSLPKISFSSEKMESWQAEETQKGPQQISFKVAIRLFTLWRGWGGNNDKWQRDMKSFPMAVCSCKLLASLTSTT